MKPGRNTAFAMPYVARAHPSRTNKSLQLSHMSNSSSSSFLICAAFSDTIVSSLHAVTVGGHLLFILEPKREPAGSRTGVREHAEPFFSSRPRFVYPAFSLTASERKRCLKHASDVRTGEKLNASLCIDVKRPRNTEEGSWNRLIFVLLFVAVLFLVLLYSLLLYPSVFLCRTSCFVF